MHLIYNEDNGYINSVQGWLHINQLNSAARHNILALCASLSEEDVQNPDLVAACNDKIETIVAMALSQS